MGASSPHSTVKIPSQSSVICRRDSQQTAQEHVLWAWQHSQRNERFWRCIRWSDKSRFCLYHVDIRIRVWRRRGKDYNQGCVQQGHRNLEALEWFGDDVLWTQDPTDYSPRQPQWHQVSRRDFGRHCQTTFPAVLGRTANVYGWQYPSSSGTPCGRL